MPTILNRTDLPPAGQRHERWMVDLSGRSEPRVAPAPAPTDPAFEHASHQSNMALRRVQAIEHQLERHRSRVEHHTVGDPEWSGVAESLAAIRVLETQLQQAQQEYQRCVESQKSLAVSK